MAYSVIVTGEMGAGKSLVLSFFKGFPVFEADKEARKLLSPQSPCHGKLKKLLGPHLAYSKGQADRKRLAKALFEDASLRKKTERLIHPLVRERFKAFQERHKKSLLVFLEAPLILSLPAMRRYDFIALITAPKALRRQRLLERGFSPKDISLRFRSARPLREARAVADFTLSNSGARGELRSKAKALLKSLLAAAKEKEAAAKEKEAAAGA